MTALLPQRAFGRTGEQVSHLGMGGFHIGTQASERESIDLIRSAIDAGITFLDNCWDYNEGASEVRMGKALRDGYRERVFLMSKVDGRDKRSAAVQIDESLRRLQTDRLDLLQLHEVIRMDDADRAWAPGGAMEAFFEARDAGKIRFIGFTGHKHPAIHLHMLQTAFAHDFTFDAVQMPLNVMDAHYESFALEVMPVALLHDIAVIGMKPFGDHFVLDTGLVEPVDMLHYAFNLPASVIVTGIDRPEILAQALQAARSFKPLSSERNAEILAKTAEAARSGASERYKTSTQFDATSLHPEWLG